LAAVAAAALVAGAIAAVVIVPGSSTPAAPTRTFSASDCRGAIQHEMAAGVRSKLTHLGDPVARTAAVHAAMVVCDALIADLDVAALRQACGASDASCIGGTAEAPCIVVFKLGVQASLMGVDESTVDPNFDSASRVWYAVGGDEILVLPDGEDMLVGVWTWDNAMGLCQATFYYLATGTELWR
jgi:hypothetical protein